ncbi:MAG: ubiquitin-like domain-containing protein [Litorilinea sp.]
MASISIDPRKLSASLGPLATGWSLTAYGSVAVLFLAALWFGAAKPVTVIIDGVEHRVTTHRRTPDAILRDLGVAIVPVDRVSMPVQARLARNAEIVVARAQPYQLVIDGRSLEVFSWGETVGAVLDDAGFVVDAYDTILLNGRSVQLTDGLQGAAMQGPNTEPLASTQAATFSGRVDGGEPGSVAAIARMPQHIQVLRSIPLTIHDSGMAFEVKTTAETVGEALREAELTIYLGDLVNPGQGTPVSPGLKVHIQRSQPVQVSMGDYALHTRTRAETVAEALAELNIGLSGEDVIVPTLDTPIAEGLAIQITRISEEIVVEEEIAPFDTVFVADPNLEIDAQQVNAPGAEGITRTRYRVRYENDEEVSRVLEDTWIAQEPGDRIIAYGQRIDPRTFTAADGSQITYWRRIQMHASSYSAGTAGVSTSSPTYGRTRTGDRMRHGIVAVDPSVIPLRSQVYVPDYGYGDALDTGSAIISRRIDLGYDDSNLVLWGRWVDVYLLWPPPPANQITWVIPNWPRPPQ